MSAVVDRSVSFCHSAHSPRLVTSPDPQHDSTFLDWQSRLHDEFFSVQSGFDRISEDNFISFNGLGAPSPSPPWDRHRPCAQRAFRGDGSRVRDGGGVGSPLLVDPVHASKWPDPLKNLRVILQWAVSNSGVKTCISRCEQACSQLARAVERGQDVSAQEVTYASLQTKLRDAVAGAGDAALTKLRKVATAVLQPSQQLDFSVPEGQPFRLRLMSTLAAACQDIDANFPLVCEHGVTLGDVEPLPDCLHFPCKSDDVDYSSEPITWSRNYVSAENAPEIVRELLTEDLDPANGFARGPFSWAELLAFLGLPGDTPEPAPDCAYAQLCEGVAVMRLGCVDECVYDADGVCTTRKYRLVCDGTASGVNPRVALPCVCETPGLLDGEALFSVPCGDLHMVGMKVDVKGAFKRVKLRPDQFAHAVFHFDGKWYVYVVLPFGMKASAFHWVRLYSVVHRLLKRVLQSYFHGSLMYIDDSLYSARVSEFPEVFSVILVFLHLLGVPVSWKKLFIGNLLDWVGFRIDFTYQRVFLSTVRLAKLRAQMHDIDSAPRVPVKQFQKLVFRMVWACQCFPMAKVFLHYFFAVLCSNMAATGYIYRVASLAVYFDFWEELISAAQTWQSAVTVSRFPRPLAVTRTDAMASDHGIFVAGWSAPSVEAFRAGNFSWFAFELDKAFFPDSKVSPNHMISAAEAAAVALALAAFGGSIVDSDSMVTVCGTKKWYSGSPNLAHAMKFVVRAACHHKFRPRIDHVPGKENALADALSRMHIDAAAAALLAELPAARRVPTEVFTRVLPEFDGYISIPALAQHDVGVRAGCCHGCLFGL